MCNNFVIAPLYTSCVLGKGRARDRTSPSLDVLIIHSLFFLFFLSQSCKKYIIRKFSLTSDFFLF